MSLSIADAAAGCSTSLAISDPSWCLLLSPTRASQSIHRCSEVSSPMLHNLQSGDSSLPTRTSHRLRAGWWPVLKRVRSTLSLLDSVSSSFSLISPRYTCLSRGCPTSSPAISLLIRARRLALSSGTSLCSIPPPSAANLSASSLPGTLLLLLLLLDQAPQDCPEKRLNPHWILGELSHISSTSLACSPPLKGRAPHPQMLRSGPSDDTIDR